MNELAKINNDLATKLNEFTEALSSKPSETEIKINKQANNSSYIPIEVTESKLDYYFNGLWKTTDFKWQVIANELAGSIQLHIFHPVAGVWLERSGGAGVMIQFKKDSEISDINNKIKNTLVKDVGHLKTECIKNAAKSLGRQFGRNLNRDYDDGLGELESMSQSIEDLKDTKDIKNLIACFNALSPIMQSDKRVINIFKEQKIRLAKK